MLQEVFQPACSLAVDPGLFIEVLFHYNIDVDLFYWKEGHFQVSTYFAYFTASYLIWADYSPGTVFRLQNIVIVKKKYLVLPFHDLFGFAEDVISSLCCARRIDFFV